LTLLKANSARAIDTLFHDRGELELVAGPALVRGQGPRRGLEREVVVRHRLLPGRRGHGERQDERAALAGVADQPRRLHVRRRLGGGLARAGEADLRRARRQRDDALAHDDRLELAHALLVVGEDRVARELLRLERAQDAPVVARGEALFARDQRRERVHLVLDLAERDLRARDQLLELHVDADVAQRR
jgi:hypothetical protein